MYYNANLNQTGKNIQCVIYVNHYIVLVYKSLFADQSQQSLIYAL